MTGLETLAGMGILGPFAANISRECKCTADEPKTVRDCVTISYVDGRENEVIESGYKDELAEIQFEADSIIINKSVDKEKGLLTSRRIPIHNVKEYTYEVLETEANPDIEFMVDMFDRNTDERGEPMSVATVAAKCSCKVIDLARDWFMANVFDDNNRPADNDDFDEKYEIKVRKPKKPYEY